MPGWIAQSTGALQLQFTSIDDLLTYLNETVAPVANAYGYRVVIEPISPKETRVDRA